MTWSLQLTVWALPPLLAVLVVLRDMEYLWPRRREIGVPALLAASFIGGLWAFLALVAVISPPLEMKLVLERVQYVPGAIAPVAWTAFALTYARRVPELKRWPFLVLCVLALVTVVMSADGDPRGMLVRDVELVDLQGTVGLQVLHGPWHWAHVGFRATALVWSGVILVGYLLRTGLGSTVPWAVAGVSCALAPAVIQLSAVPGAAWADQTPAGFALGAAVLGWGLLRRRLLDLGPVARTLVMDELRDPMVVLDARGRIVDANRAAESVLGLRPYGDVPVALGTLWASSGKEIPEAKQLELDVAEGGPRTFEVMVSRLGGGRGPGHSALLLLDVTERERMRRSLVAKREALREANAELKRLANTDELTGLANRRHFMEQLEHEIDRALRYDRPLSLVLLDLDHFKQVNDAHGHAAGDQVLRAAATALRAVCRDLDLAARIGGEELALIVPETATDGAHTVAERVRARIEEDRHRAPSGAGFRVTGSIGIASLEREAPSAEALLQAADEALYRAKAEGRNRVIAADQS